MQDKETALKEIQRKSIHIVVIVVIPLDFYFGLTFPSILALILSCLYMLSEHMRRKEKCFPIVQNITKSALRNKPALHTLQTRSRSNLLQPHLQVHS